MNGNLKGPHAEAALPYPILHKCRIVQTLDCFRNFEYFFSWYDMDVEEVVDIFLRGTTYFKSINIKFIQLKHKRECAFLTEYLSIKHLESKNHV